MKREIKEEKGMETCSTLVLSTCCGGNSGSHLRWVPVNFLFCKLMMFVWPGESYFSIKNLFPLLVFVNERGDYLWNMACQIELISRDMPSIIQVHRSIKIFFFLLETLRKFDYSNCMLCIYIFPCNLYNSPSCLICIITERVKLLHVLDWAFSASKILLVELKPCRCLVS